MSNQTFTASAPGRLDVMGGIADYSGSLVLQKSIKERTHVQCQLRDDGQCIIRSEVENEGTLTIELPYHALLKDNQVDYRHACQYFKERKLTWAAYILGCILVLNKERGIKFPGADISVTSTVPLGKGVSSSASLEVATMKALAQAFNLDFEGTALPVLAQRVENMI